MMTIRRLFPSRPRTPAVVLLAGILAGLLAAACGGGDDPQQQAQAPAVAQQTADSADQPQQQQSAQPEPQVQPADQAAEQDAQQSVAAAAPPDVDALAPVPVAELSPRLQLLAESGYPVYLSGDGFTISLGTPDLGPGPQRVSIVVESAEGLVEFPALALSYWAEGEDAPPSEALATFTRFPDGVRGFHLAQLDFSQPGRWVVSVRVPTVDGFADLPLSVEVRAETLAPTVGAQAPASINRTLRDVEGAEQLSTGAEPDAALYELTVAEALERGEPLVIVFASPGFCTNAFCGPQVEVLSQLRERYPDSAAYIHVDLYENPLEVRRGEPPVETPLLKEWGLETDEWTFIVDAEGRVAARFEAFAPLEEVEAALTEVLARS